jgi:hypothetical protein
MGSAVDGWYRHDRARGNGSPAGGDNADHENLPKGIDTDPPCWNDPNYTTETTLNEVEVARAGPHGFETYGIASYPVGTDSSYPGDAALNRASDILCNVRVRRFVGIDSSLSTLSVLPATPTRDEWNGGDNIISCYLHDHLDEPLVGSMHNARR